MRGVSLPFHAKRKRHFQIIPRIDAECDQGFRPLNSFDSSDVIRHDRRELIVLLDTDNDGKIVSTGNRYTSVTPGMAVIFSATAFVLSCSTLSSTKAVTIAYFLSCEDSLIRFASSCLLASISARVEVAPLKFLIAFGT